MENTGGYHAALDRYDQQRSPYDHVIEKVLPADPGPVHAVPRSRYRNTTQQPMFLDRFAFENAMCGKRVKVLLSLEFDPGDEDSCPRCVGPVLRNERVAPEDQELRPP